MDSVAHGHMRIGVLGSLGVRAQLRPACLVERTKLYSTRRAWKEASEQPMLWGTLDNLDMNTSHPVLTIRPDSPDLQAILIFEDAPLIYFRNYGIVQRRAGSETDLPPPRAQRSEIYSRRCCLPPIAKQKRP